MFKSLENERIVNRENKSVNYFFKCFSFFMSSSLKDLKIFSLFNDFGKIILDFKILCKRKLNVFEQIEKMKIIKKANQNISRFKIKLSDEEKAKLIYQKNQASIYQVPCLQIQANINALKNKFKENGILHPNKNKPCGVASMFNQEDVIIVN